MQPVFIQWTATADPAGTYNATELHDGWYVIETFEPNYERFLPAGLVECKMSVSFVAPAPPRRVALGYAGAALSSNFSVAAANLLSVPIGTTVTEPVVSRTAAEGAISCILAPVASPEPVILSATLANVFKGGVHVYDTINTTSNPVPTTGGTFVHANWVEVFGTDHDFVGDCVVTNGLQLLLFQTGNNFIQCYLWNTALAAANWQKYAAGLTYFDNAASQGIWQQYSLARLGPEEVAVTATAISAGNGALATIRLQRGRYEGRIDFRPLTQAATSVLGLTLQFIATPKILYNTGAARDVGLDGSPPTQNDVGYGAGFINSATYPFIAGFLYQNQAANMPYNNTNTNVGFGDSASLAVNAQRSYGFFAIPYGVSGTYSTVNLQSEAELGALGTGWTSVADVSASAGNTAQCASGTVAGNADLFGTAFSPTAGTYDVWMRIRVTDNTVSSLEMTAGIWNPTAGAFVASGSTTLNRNAMTTTYSWVRVALGLTLPAANATQFRVVTALTTTTAWFIDEAALVLNTWNSSGPRDLWSQFAFDRGVKWIRP